MRTARTILYVHRIGQMPHSGIQFRAYLWIFGCYHWSIKAQTSSMVHLNTIQFFLFFWCCCFSSTPTVPMYTFTIQLLDLQCAYKRIPIGNDLFLEEQKKKTNGANHWSSVAASPATRMRWMENPRHYYVHYMQHDPFICLVIFPFSLVCFVNSFFGFGFFCEFSKLRGEEKNTHTQFSLPTNYPCIPSHTMQRNSVKICRSHIVSEIRNLHKWSGGGGGGGKCPLQIHKTYKQIGLRWPYRWNKLSICSRLNFFVPKNYSEQMLASYRCYEMCVCVEIVAKKETKKKITFIISNMYSSMLLSSCSVDVLHFIFRFSFVHCVRLRSSDRSSFFTSYTYIYAFHY